MLVDLDKWPRKNIYQHFCSVSFPYYSVSFEVDVTEALKYAKKNQISFYQTMIYLVTASINQVEAFHYTIRNKEVHYIEKRTPSFTDLNTDTDLFKIVTPTFENDLITYAKNAVEQSKKQDFFLDYSSETDELIYISCLPWLPHLSINEDRDIYDQDDSIPRIAWGKYESKGDRIVLNLSINVNHKLIDGVHIGQFYTELSKEIDQLGENQ